MKGLLTLVNETDFPLFIIMFVYSTRKLTLRRSISTSDHTHIPTGEHTPKLSQSRISQRLSNTVSSILTGHGTKMACWSGIIASYLSMTRQGYNVKPQEEPKRLQKSVNCWVSLRPLVCYYGGGTTFVKLLMLGCGKQYLLKLCLCQETELSHFHCWQQI